jgi:hypothetical protein
VNCAETNTATGSVAREAKHREGSGWHLPDDHHHMLTDYVIPARIDRLEQRIEKLEVRMQSMQDKLDQILAIMLPSV